MRKPSKEQAEVSEDRVVSGHGLGFEGLPERNHGGGGESLRSELADHR
jgi:hypothetical protein